MKGETWGLTPEKLDYLEREGSRNIEFHLGNIDFQKKEAQTTMTMVFVMVGASFTGAVNLISKTGQAGWGVGLALVCIYLGWQGVRLTFDCLAADKVMPPTNEPRNLQKDLDGYTVDEIRSVEIENLQARIDVNQSRSLKMGESLNQIRYRLCAAPAVYLFAVAVIAMVTRAFGYHLF